MKDVLLITLHKQHYADKYDNELFRKNISCLGYYDEITISDLSDVAGQEERCRLSKKKSNAPMSAIWYGIGDQVQSLTGGYSNQNIGVFRSALYSEADKHLENYWTQELQLPFFGIGFIKLEDAKEYIDLCKTIEITKWANEEDEECEVILYSTFENADLVIMCKSNKWSLLENVFSSIQKKQCVLYTHSILGIDEEYIEWCSKGNCYSLWNEKRCFIEENIKRIDFKIATCGSSEILEELRFQWEGSADKIKGYDSTKYSHVTGHSDISLTIEDTNVKALVQLLLPKGLLTHTNPAYSRGVYNIETSICLHENKWSEVNSKENAIATNNEKNSHCRALIQKYKELLEKTNKYEEGLYSYYQALILTLNILIQYENFYMSRNIYELIYPSFNMFDTQIRELWKQSKETQDTKAKMQILNRIKSAVEQYLECINSVIYHTIHTDQVYLMIPGYSGTFFSIPIKLSQLYMWFLTKVSEILKDQGREYSCILMPVMETKPVTKEIEIQPEHNNRLICVKLSQRELYFPRNLMIILCHELGHYISDAPRCREIRLECLIKALSRTIVEGIVPQDGILRPMDMAVDKWETYLNELKNALYDMIFSQMKAQKDKVFLDKEYYSDDIAIPLINLSKSVISEDDFGQNVIKKIYSFSKQLVEYVDKPQEMYVNRMRAIYEVQSKMDENRKALLTSDILTKLISKLIKIYKEVYSDIVAIKILQTEQEDFEESFAVSEGVIYTDIEVPENEVRMTIAENSLYRLEGEVNCQSEEIAWGTLNGGISINQKLEDYLLENIYLFQWNISCLLEYANTCISKMEEYLKDKEEILNDVRSVYLMFCNKDKTREEIYFEIVERIENYKVITELLQSDEKNIDI